MLIIPLTDHITIQTFKLWYKKGYISEYNQANQKRGWKSGGPNTEFWFHIPINWD